AALGRIKPYGIAREAERGAPHRAVAARRDAVERHVDAAVLVGIERLIRLGVFVALAVAVGVEDERGPTLRLHFVAGLLVHLYVDPAGRTALRAACAEPQRVVGVETELQVMRREARADHLEFLRLRIIHRDVAVRCVDWEDLRRRMIGARLAVVRIWRRTDAGGKPDARLLVEVEA